MKYVEVVNSQAVVKVTGQLRLKVADDVKDELYEALDKGITNIVFDMSNVTYIDSASLGMFVEVKDRFDVVNGEILVVNLQENGLELFRMTMMYEDFCV